MEKISSVRRHYCVYREKYKSRREAISPSAKSNRPERDVINRNERMAGISFGANPIFLAKLWFVHKDTDVYLRNIYIGTRFKSESYSFDQQKKEKEKEKEKG